MTEKKKSFPFSVLLRLLVGIGILAALIARSDLRALTIVWDSRTLAGLLFAVLILGSAQIFSALRWKFLLGNEDGLSFLYLLRIYLIGFFFGLFLPTSVGGDAVRAVAVSKASKRPGWAVSSVVLERAFGLLAMFCLLGVGAYLAPHVFMSGIQRTTFNFQPTVAGTVIGLAMLLGIAALGMRVLARSERLRRLMRDALGLWGSVRERPAAFAAAFAMSVLVQSAYLFAWYELALALRFPVPATEFLVFVPFVSIAAMLPVTIAGIGLREGAWALLLSAHGVGSADAVAYSLLYFVAFVIVGLFGGAAFALKGLGREPSDAIRPPANSVRLNSALAPAHES